MPKKHQISKISLIKHRKPCVMFYYVYQIENKKLRFIDSFFVEMIILNLIQVFKELIGIKMGL